MLLAGRFGGTRQLEAMNPHNGAAGEWRRVEYRATTSLGKTKASVMAALRHVRLNPECRVREVEIVRIER